MRNAATLERARTIAGRVAADPVWFARTMLGHDLWPTQERILAALARPRARVAVKSCHASSKTFTAAEAVLWAPFAGGVAVTTAPTARQVRRLVWTEVRAMHPRAAYGLGGELLQAEFRIAPDRYAVGLSTDQGVNFQGFHARPGGFLLVVMDEAPGIDPGVFAAVEGIRAGGDVRVLLLGNPDVTSGPFYDVFHEQRAGWDCLTIDAFDTPNLAGLTLPQLLDLPDGALDANERPYLITRRFVREKYDEWGEASPLWQSKVRGQFPAQGEDALLSLAWLERAGGGDYAPADGDAWEAGIDVAGPGEDETVLVVRHGGHLGLLRTWGQADPRGEVLAALVPFQERLARVKVDTVGTGHYFARHLEDNGYRGRVVDVNVGESPRDREKYANLKAEHYWGLRQRFAAGEVSGLTDQRAVAQLAGIRYRHDARGRVVIESKDEARKRGVKSPDRAEAIMLAFAAAPPRRHWGAD